MAPAGPEEALRLARYELPSLDLLVTDAVMPGMSGPALSKEVLATRPDTRVLFISGYTDDAMLRLGLLQPNQAFLQKPFGPKTFIRKVREMLEVSPVATPTGGGVH